MVSRPAKTIPLVFLATIRTVLIASKAPIIAIHALMDFETQTLEIVKDALMKIVNIAQMIQTTAYLAREGSLVTGKEDVFLVKQTTALHVICRSNAIHVMTPLASSTAVANLVWKTAKVVKT